MLLDIGMLSKATHMNLIGVFFLFDLKHQKRLFLTKNFLNDQTEYPADAQTIKISRAVKFQKLL